MLYKSFFLLFFALLSLQCTKSNSELNNQKNIVAQIGPAVITSDEFLTNYEFGFTHLKSPMNPKLSYLKAMINEKLLSLEGYNNNIHKNKNIQHKKAQLNKDLLIEYLLKKEVNSLITISDNEIKNAINKSSVSYNLRFWTEENLELANNTFENIRHNGFKHFIEKIILDNPDINLSIDQFETGYMSWLDFPEELHNSIKDLPLNAISQPVHFNDKYWIFQVLNIRRSGVLESEYSSKSATFKKILYQNKLSTATTHYVSSLMIPKDIRTKYEPFNILSSFVWKWLKTNTGDTQPFVAYLQNKPDAMLDDWMSKPLITHIDGEITVDEFAHTFDFSLLQNNFPNKNAMMQKFNLEIAWFIRDHFLVELALEKQINRLPELKKELKLWVDKWVYEEFRQNCTLNELSLKLEQLKNIYPIKINSIILDSIEVTGTTKSRWLTVHNYKMGTNRMAIPIVDGSWKLAPK